LSVSAAPRDELGEEVVTTSTRWRGPWGYVHVMCLHPPILSMRYLHPGHGLLDLRTSSSPFFSSSRRFVRSAAFARAALASCSILCRVRRATIAASPFFLTISRSSFPAHRGLRCGHARDISFATALQRR